MLSRLVHPRGIQQVVSPRGDILVVMSLGHFERLSSAAGQSGGVMDDGWGDPAGGKPAPMPDPVRDAIDRGETPLLAWRRYRRISQIRLAEISGISRHTILRIERDGAGAGNRHSRSKLAAALGIAIGSL